MVASWHFALLGAYTKVPPGHFLCNEIMTTETKNNQSLIERLFKAGAHFGFSKSRRHPTVKPYLFGNKQGTDIFDLERVAELLHNAQAVLTEAGSLGKVVLFVGTKEETSKLVRAHAEQVDAPFVVHRWIGGMLTNFPQIKKRLDRLTALMAEGESGELERKYTKKERVVLRREMEKLNNNFGGIRTLEKTPDLLVVVDPRHDSIAVTEAREIGIPVVGIMSSDTNMSKITYPVLANDTLQASVSLLLDELTNAYQKGKEAYTPKPASAPKPRTRA